MGNAITIARTPVATFEKEVSKFIHWNFQAMLLVSLKMLEQKPLINRIALLILQLTEVTCSEGTLLQTLSQNHRLGRAHQSYDEKYNLWSYKQLEDHSEWMHLESLPNKLLIKIFNQNINVNNELLSLAFSEVLNWVTIYSEQKIMKYAMHLEILLKFLKVLIKIGKM